MDDDAASRATGDTISRDEIAMRLEITDPFLMIDRFELIEKGRMARGYKDLGVGDWFFAAHLPQSQVMPATLQIEGMLQTLALLIYASEDHGAHRSFVTDINVQLVSAAKPGRTITYDAKLLSFRRGLARGEVMGMTNGEVLCRGAFTYASPHLMVAPKL